RHALEVGAVVLAEHATGGVPHAHRAQDGALLHFLWSVALDGEPVPGLGELWTTGVPDGEHVGIEGGEAGAADERAVGEDVAPAEAARLGWQVLEPLPRAGLARVDPLDDVGAQLASLRQVALRNHELAHFEAADTVRAHGHLEAPGGRLRLLE